MSEKKSLRDKLGISGDEPKSFLEHLEELRSTIVWSAVVFVVCFIVACFMAPNVLRFLVGPLSKIDGIDPSKFILSIDVSEPFMIWMKIGIWTGLIISLPIIICIVGSFIIPGLTERERRTVAIALGASALLFAFGVWECYYFTLPVALDVMLWIPEKLSLSVPGWTLGSYTIFALRLLLAFGLAFELPIVVYSLGSLGIIKSQQMREKRRHVIVGLLVLSMFLTPQDPWTMLMMAIPLIILFEISVWLVRVHERLSSGSDEASDDEFEFDEYDDLNDDEGRD